MANPGNIKEILRNQAWQRAKGELASVLATYYGEGAKYDMMQNLLVTFEDAVERSAILEVDDSVR